MEWLQRELTPADYIAMLRRRWVLIVVLALVGAPLAYGVSRLLPNKIQVADAGHDRTADASPHKIVESLDTSDINQRLSSMQQQILSRSRLEPIIRQFNLYPQDVNRKSMDELVARLQKAIEVTPIAPMTETRAQQLPGFYVAVTLDNARNAQEVCTAVTSMFIEQNLRLRQEHSEMTTQFLAQELASAKASLDEQDAKLAAFQEPSHRRAAGRRTDQSESADRTDVAAGCLDAGAGARATGQDVQRIAAFSASVAAWQASQTGQNPETLEQQLVALQTHLTTLQSSYTDDYPDVIKAKNDIAVLQKKIAESDGPNNAAGRTRARRRRSSRPRSNSSAPKFTTTT